MASEHGTGPVPDETTPDRSAPAKPAAPGEPGSGDAGTDVAPGRMTSPDSPGAAVGPALLAGLVSAVLLAVGSALPVVAGAGARGFDSAPLLVVLSVLPAGLAAIFVARRRPVLASGVLAGSALLTPGRALLDLQLLADSSLSSRPELFVPVTMAGAAAGTGLWLLLAGHAAAIVSGVLALRAITASPENRADPIGQLDRAGSSGGAEQTRRGEAATGALVSGERLNTNQRWLILALVVGLLALVGILLQPFSSTDPYLLARPALDAPVFTLLGSMALAIGVPLGAGFAASAAARAVTRGVLLGLAVTLAAVEVPHIVSASVVPRVGPAAGPIVVLFAALGLIGVAWSPAGRDSTADVADSGGPPGEASPPSGYALHAVAGAFAVLAAGAAWLSGSTEHVSSAGELPAGGFTKRMLLPAGTVVGVLGLAVLARGTSAFVRPALSVAWVLVPLAGTAALETVTTATRVGTGVEAGPGAAWAAVAMLLALAAGVACAVAGTMDRDEGEFPEGRPSRPNLAAYGALAVAALLAVGAFGLPVMQAPDYEAPDLFANFRTSSYGLALALVAVVAATGLAIRARPSRAVVLLLGAASLPVVHALELPLTGARVAGATAGPGTWLSVACAGALLVGAGAVMAGRHAR